MEALGHQVDRELADGDVRLTQGGEPTFVSIDDMDGAEWNTDALGEQKWKLANRLLERLRDCFAPGGVPHFGQGKWYPGEPLPRWALNVFWRADGVPVWKNNELVAHEAGKAIDAGRFGRELARRLGLHPDYLLPGYEDPWRALDEESRLPVNVDPLAADLDDPGKRLTLARQLRAGLAGVVGFFALAIFMPMWDLTQAQTKM